MAIPSIKNRVGCATATTGTGTITLGSAESGYQSFTSAYGANANVDILIEDGTAWEIARDCTYDNSAGTVTRGTLEASSTGAAINLSGSAKVYVVESANRMQRMVGGYLENSNHDGTANVTGVAGTMHVFTALTADRNFTLPSAASTGDRIGLAFPGGSASYEISILSASGDKINNVDCSATEWSSLLIAGEVVIFRCINGSTVDWVVEYDGRIPCYAEMSAGSGGTWNAATLTTPDFSTSVSDVGGLVDLANNRFNVRRSGQYLVTANALSANSPSQTTGVFAGSLYFNATTNYEGFRSVYAVSSNRIQMDRAAVKSISTGPYYAEFQHNSTNTTFLNAYFAIKELL